jgi:hypothetical protein
MGSSFSVRRNVQHAHSRVYHVRSGTVLTPLPQTGVDCEMRDERVVAPPGRLFSNHSKRGVREIVAENLPKAAAFCSHSLCTALT